MNSWECYDAAIMIGQVNHMTDVRPRAAKKKWDCIWAISKRLNQEAFD